MRNRALRTADARHIPAVRDWRGRSIGLILGRGWIGVSTRTFGAARKAPVRARELANAERAASAPRAFAGRSRSASTTPQCQTR
jgi:hypothetical protein